MLNLLYEILFFVPLQTKDRLILGDGLFRETNLILQGLSHSYMKNEKREYLKRMYIKFKIKYIQSL